MSTQQREPIPPSGEELEYFVKVVDALGLKECHPQLVDMAMTHLGSSLGQEALDAPFDNDATAAIEARLKTDRPSNSPPSPRRWPTAEKRQPLTCSSKFYSIRLSRSRFVKPPSEGSLAHRPVDLSTWPRAVNIQKPRRLPAALTKIMNVSVRNRAREHFPIPALKGATELPQMTELLVYVGNHKRGRTIFEQTTCVQCHQVNGKGINFGPDLPEIGGKLSKQGLYESILDPSATVSPAFRAVNIVRRERESVFRIYHQRNERRVNPATSRWHDVYPQKTRFKTDHERPVPHAARVAAVDDV